nr:hypothetical protein CFP56_23312 [Quercus suber]
MDDLVPMTPAGSETISEESDDSPHTKEWVTKNNGVVIAQPVLDGTVTLLVLSVENPPIKDVENPSA